MGFYIIRSDSGTCTHPPQFSAYLTSILNKSGFYSRQHFDRGRNDVANRGRGHSAKLLVIYYPDIAVLLEQKPLDTQPLHD